MSESNDRASEQQPSNKPTPNESTRVSSPLFHRRKPSGRGLVIGGVDGFPPAPQTEASDDDKPSLTLLAGTAITFENVMKMFEELTGRPATPEEREEALREWQKSESKDGPQ